MFKTRVICIVSADTVATSSINKIVNLCLLKTPLPIGNVSDMRTRHRQVPRQTLDR